MESDILKLIYENDGRWSWYQLDRALSVRQLHGGGRLIKVLQHLEENGLIRSEASSEDSVPRYYVTDAGKRLLKEPHQIPRVA
ncbi:MAG: hypothetical protein QOC96_3523 [Acidobacteriota bacterium]|jgi:DNA-binding PadR family transcriptional regulator|nr:hypothetical protein [Acidobacteriota bacterium]